MLQSKSGSISNIVVRITFESVMKDSSDSFLMLH